MIIGAHREQVIEHIRSAVEAGDFYRKVEVDDPVLTPAECREITDGYLRERKRAGYRLKSFLARRIANAGTVLLNRDTEIVGEEHLPDLRRGCILTSNHFGPLENTVIRQLVRKHGKRRLNVVCQVTNLAMTGWVGFLMRYADTIPLSTDFRYLSGPFLSVLEELLRRDEAVLIYPEQEMWFNYRKPRPPKRGAYHFAAKLGVPVVSCFVEMVDTEKMDAPGFRQVRYRLHVLGTLYPDPALSVRACSEQLCQQDYALKKAAYERVYGRALTDSFMPEDIAGWVNEEA